MNDFSEEFVTDYTCEGKCSNCGKCCSNMLPLTRKEIKAIKAYVKKHHIKEQRHNAAVGVDMTCPFRDEGKRICLIYEVRPSICESFICNRDPEFLQKSKLRHHNRGLVVPMRSEFFGNTEDTELLNLIKAMSNVNGA